jgi:hypothetical protein
MIHSNGCPVSSLVVVVVSTRVANTSCQHVLPVHHSELGYAINTLLQVLWTQHWGEAATQDTVKKIYTPAKQLLAFLSVKGREFLKPQSDFVNREHACSVRHYTEQVS